MNRAEAHAILAALRPGHPEAGQAPFKDALAFAESDPILKAWWQAQQEFDRKVTAKLAEIAPPPGLRENLLATRKITRFEPPVRYSTWLAAAAVVAFLCVAGVFWQIANYGPVDRSDYADQAVSELGNDQPALALLSKDHEQVLAWLKAQNAPLGSMPPKFEALPSIGCQKYVIHGHTVSLVCFSLANGGEAHLFIVDKSALNDPPGTNAMEFGNVKNWNVASWSDDRMTYLVATQSDMDTLKQLL
jgi:hypothetical protein